MHFPHQRGVVAGVWWLVGDEIDAPSSPFELLGMVAIIAKELPALPCSI
jgi:hypothetical protein